VFKYIKAFFKGLYKIVLAYPKIRKYAKNKDKYPLEERYAYARKLVNILMKSFNVELDVEGIEKLNNKNDFFVVCNHQGVMDALVMVSLFDRPTSFVCKKEALKYPFVGKVCTFIDAIFFERDNVRDSVKMIKSCINKLNDGYSVGIFPEGTRTKDENYMPGEYKPGALKPAYETKKNIAVFVMNGGYKVFSKKYKGKIVITVKVIDFLDYEEFKDKNTLELANEIQKKTVDELIKISKQ